MTEMPEKSTSPQPKADSPVQAPTPPPQPQPQIHSQPLSPTQDPADNQANDDIEADVSPLKLDIWRSISDLRKLKDNETLERDSAFGGNDS